MGAALSFSSTIIALKLLPTTVLHRQHMGEVVISVLLIQDLLAILVLLLLQQNSQEGGGNLWSFVKVFIELPLLIFFSLLFERTVIVRLLQRFEQHSEYLFLLSLGWCLGMAELAHFLGLSAECGAFLAGVALAENPISEVLAERLKPLRDFFLIMFFFSVGAGFDLFNLRSILLPTVLITVALLMGKPFIFSKLLQKTGESSSMAWKLACVSINAVSFRCSSPRLQTAAIAVY